MALSTRRRDADISNISTTRSKNYTLNKETAIDKKIDACDRNTSAEEKSGNFCYEFSTAGFEVFRKTLFDHIHLPRQGYSRQVEHIIDTDEENHIVQDTLKMKNWMALDSKLSNAKTGTCSITINLYRTTSKVVINGRDAHLLAPAIKKLLDQLSKSKNIKVANTNLKKALKEKQHPNMEKVP